MDSVKRLVVGVSGASGAPLAVELLRYLSKMPTIETHLIITPSAVQTIECETSLSLEEFNSLADVVYDNLDMGAALSSGTYRTMGMVVVPCSMKTAAGIATGYSDNLLLRAADVILKEQRKLVLVTRETPLNTIHLKNMLTLSQMGVSIVPPAVAFYNNPETVDDIIRHIVGKVLDQFGIEYTGLKRWLEA